MTVDSVVGNWTGTIRSESEDFSTQVDLSIQIGCTIGSVCGTVSGPNLPCSGKIVLREVQGETFVFVEQDITEATILHYLLGEGNRS
jgi:hypothetical protein